MRRVQTAVAALLAAAVFPPPGGGAAWGWEDGKLLIWINGDKGYAGIEEMGRVFEENTGVKVEVEHPDGTTDKFTHAAQSGTGPDVLIWAHDRLGEWADTGLLWAVEPSEAFWKGVFPKAREAFTHRGRTWGWPLAMETTGLIYNKALVKEEELPERLEDFAELDGKLKAKGARALLWDYGNSYFTWGILAGAGGYVFGRGADGEWDTKDIGVNAEGAVRAADVVAGLIRGGTMPVGASYSAAEAQMCAGKLAAFVSGPFAWDNLRKSGIDFGVTTIPGAGGGTAKPFVGVLGAMVNRASPNGDLAQEFLEHYLITPTGLAAMDRHVPVGIPALEAAWRGMAGDEHLAGLMKNVNAGEPMPNIPEMGIFWSAMESALNNVTSLRAGGREALDNAAERMRGGGTAGQ
jgi:maltose/maltodextrin transport system substrate-binding protein